ncbi:MAG: hypothetical protein Kow0025_21140 [Thermodesulfovibrionales bacterium]
MSGVSGGLLQVYLAFTAGVVLVLVALALFFTLSKARARRARQEKEPLSEMGFVVETFQDLISTLKEKERELEALRAKAEERAGLAEDYNDNIVQSVPSGVISLDESWKVVKVNASAERILRRKASEMAGRDLREIFGDLGGEAVQRGEMRHEAGQEGSERSIWLGYSLTPLVNSRGETIGRLLVFTDLTELKALKAQAEIRERLSSLGEMAAGIAHELRNPMGVISGYARMLSRKVEPPLRDAVEAVSREVAAMDRIISDFLSFARQGELRVSEVDLAGLARECGEAACAAAGGVAFSMDGDGRVPLRADETLMRQALANLFVNAVEAMEGRGKIAVSVSVQGGRAVMEVRDTGPGIPEEARERVFQPFFTTKAKGTGLGLAIVHRVVTAHGGSIEVRPGGPGAAFRINLPL